jgi:uncharacterized protein YuzE
MKTIKLTYDEEGDILYVEFLKGRKASYQSLTDNIVLRFDPQTFEPIGLTLIDYSRLVPQGGSPPHFAFDRLTDIPSDRRNSVITILSHPPVNRWLDTFTLPGQPGAVLGSVRQPQNVLELLTAA